MFVMLLLCVPIVFVFIFSESILVPLGFEEKTVELVKPYAAIMCFGLPACEDAGADACPLP